MFRIYSSSKFYELLQSPDSYLQPRLNLFFTLSQSSRLTKSIEEKINQVIIRVGLLFGYNIDLEDMSVVQVKPLNRVEQGTIVGLYNPSVYPQITQIFKFLQTLELDKLKLLMFILLAKAMMKDERIRNAVEKSGQYQIWISLQPSLAKYHNLQDSDNVQYALDKLMENRIEDNEENEEDNDDRIEKEDKEILQMKPHVPFRGLNYTTNSCYIDSILVALFALPNDTINTYLLEKDIQSLKKTWINCGSIQNRQKIQDELLSICKSIQGGEEVENCLRFKQLIEKCGGSQDFHNNGMQDAGEFLHFLFNIFEVGIMVKIRQTYGTNQLGPEYELDNKTHEEKQIATPIINVDLKVSKDLNYFLSETEDAILTDGYTYKGTFYRRRIEKITVISTPYIVFNVQRITLNHRGVFEYNSRPVEFPDSIVFGRKRLRLHAVVVFRNRHYIAYIRYKNQWYFYNDIPQSTVVPVHESNVLTELQQNGVQYFYS